MRGVEAAQLPRQSRSRAAQNRAEMPCKLPMLDVAATLDGGGSTVSATNKIYEDDQITVTNELVESTQGSFAVRAIGSVAQVRQSKLTLLYIAVGLFALLFGGTMGSCGGLVIGAMSEYGINEWAGLSIAAAIGGIALIGLAKHLPPIIWHVRITAHGRTSVVYVTGNDDYATAVERAIKSAMSGQVES